MTERQREDDDTPLLEWIFGGIGLVLFVGALAVTILNGMTPDAPPSIVIRVEQSQAIGDRFRVEFEALNQGDEAAALVQLSAVLKDGEALVESHIVEIDLLPPNSSRRAGVFFSHDPDTLTLTVEATSYQRP